MPTFARFQVLFYCHGIGKKIFGVGKIRSSMPEFVLNCCLKGFTKAERMVYFCLRVMPIDYAMRQTA
jgi:hypothetical protein